jgi:hypothetical protein
MLGYLMYNWQFLAARFITRHLSYQMKHADFLLHDSLHNLHSLVSRYLSLNTYFTTTSTWDEIIGSTNFLSEICSRLIRFYFLTMNSNMYFYTDS